MRLPCSNRTPCFERRVSSPSNSSSGTKRGLPARNIEKVIFTKIGEKSCMAVKRRFPSAPKPVIGLNVFESAHLVAIATEESDKFSMQCHHHGGFNKTSPLSSTAEYRGTMRHNGLYRSKTVFGSLIAQLWYPSSRDVQLENAIHERIQFQLELLPLQNPRLCLLIFRIARFIRTYWQ